VTKLYSFPVTVTCLFSSLIVLLQVKKLIRIPIETFNDDSLTRKNYANNSSSVSVSSHHIKYSRDLYVCRDILVC